MFIIQAFDYEEGTGARWNALPGAYSVRDDARSRVSELVDDPNNMCKFRIVVEYSPESYAQPTDKLEY